MKALAWRNAATLILSIPTTSYAAACATDFKTLMLKRSEKSSFYANNYVFPGGCIDKADLSSSWLDLYRSVDSKFISHFDSLSVQQDNSLRPPMFFPDDKSTAAIPEEVACRICVIRETFEESGVLILRGPLNVGENTDESMTANPFVFTASSDIEIWRKKVHEDAFAFLDLCKSLRHIPDIWALHEWSSWLTPKVPGLRVKRFDTIFYKTCLSSVPDFAQHDTQETTNLIWESPDNIITSSKNGNVSLGPPQAYELGRLLNFTSFKELQRFVKQRSKKGIERWMPRFCRTIDGHPFMPYPGDRHYPRDKALCDSDEIHQVPLTYEEIISAEPRQLNHMHVINAQKYQLACDYSPPHGHVLPTKLPNYLHRSLAPNFPECLEPK